MAVAQLQIDGSQEGQGVDVLISRQAVLDRELGVRGYRVAYATLVAGDFLIPNDRSASRLLADVFSAVGLDDLVGASRAHLAVSAELLLTVGIPPVPPDRVILRVDHETATDPRLARTLGALASHGYALALNAPPGFGFDPALLEVFSMVEVDFLVWDDLDAVAAVPRIVAAQCTPLAAGLLDYSEFELAKALGFDLFTGSFFASPHVTSGRQVPVGDLSTLAALAQLNGEAPIEELEQVINHDLGLSVTLLRYINSAYFGMRSEIASIRQALMMLGSREVSRWALLTALTRGPTAPRELSVMALTRARMCEQLGAGNSQAGGDELFMIGLLSVADALLDLPLETIVAQLPLADDTAQALVWRAGPGGHILDAAIAFERGEFDADCLRPYRRAAGLEYRKSLRVARATVSRL
ncbi:MAG: EAL and HDOD domain-containing protein [Solirubrobacteraceae bacterium]